MKELEQWHNKVSNMRDPVGDYLKFHFSRTMLVVRIVSVVIAASVFAWWVLK